MDESDDDDDENHRFFFLARAKPRVSLRVVSRARRTDCYSFVALLERDDNNNDNTLAAARRLCDDDDDDDDDQEEEEEDNNNNNNNAADVVVFVTGWSSGIGFGDVRAAAALGFSKRKVEIHVPTRGFGEKDARRRL